jgi:hypothetical protein
MIEPNVGIIGIVRVDLDAAADSLSVIFALADGTHAATWWPISELHTFLSRVVTLSTASRAPGVPLQ